MTLTGGRIPKDRWARLDALFHATIELPPEERESYLNAQCGGDADLRREVALLVTADGTACGAVPDGPAVPGLSASGLVDQDSQWNPQDRIGSYRLLKHVGSGGMGTVWLAERDDAAYKKKVAIKLIKRGMDTVDILRRFRHERQVLARLEHPNIARLIDGGASEQGLPYLVMEFVDGAPIKQYCDQHQLDVESRLRLFLKVCAAVQYAHQNLIIHRDLKPSNILITNDATAKLLDFGIAKVIQPEHEDDDQSHTQTEKRFISPRYASPEQTRGELVTTAGDIYSLGVVLYELLTGQSPYPVSNSREALQRFICEHQPEKPSTAVVKRTISVPDDQEGRDAAGLDVARDKPSIRTYPQLQSDLDWVVLKALRKEPAERYATVEQFSADIERALQDRPVSARPPSWAYLTRKVVRRNRLACAFAATVAFLMLAFGVWLTRERHAAFAARDREASARASAEQIGLFLQDMLSSINPDVAMGRDVTILRELLDDASQRIDTELSDDPIVAASLHATIGYAYYTIGVYADAEVHLRQALQSRRAILGNEHTETINSLRQMGALLTQMGRYTDAERIYDEGLVICRRTRPPDDTHTLTMWGNLAWLYLYQGRYVEAESTFRQVLEAQRRVLGNDHRATISSMHALADVYRSTGRYQEAEKQFEHVTEVAYRVLGEDHPSVLKILNDFAILYTEQARFVEGAPLYEHVLATQRRILGDDHPDTLVSINNLALNYLGQRRLQESERFHLESYTRHRRKLGDDHPNTLTAMNNLGYLYWKQGRLDEAAPLYHESLEKQRRVLGPDHPETLRSTNNLATLYWSQERYDETEPLLVETLDAKRRIFGDEHPSTLNSLSNLAALYKTQERYEDARPLYLKTLDARKRVLGAEHPETFFSMNSLAALLNSQKQYGEAYRMGKTTLEKCRRALGEDHEETEYATYVLARSLRGLQRYEEAYRLAVPYYERCLNTKGELHDDTIDAVKLIVDVLEARGMPDEASTWRSKSEADASETANN